MRVLPRSLFGRLVLVLSVGLTVALVGSAAINLRERHHLLEHAGAERFAQRIATTTGLIDRLAPADRQQLVRVMSSPRSSLAISPSPELLPSNTPLPRHLVRFSNALSNQLGPEYPMEISARKPEHGSRGMFQVAIRLHDGNWLTITDRRPPHPLGRQPYTLLIQLGVLLLVALLLSLLAVTWVTRPLAMLAHAARDLGRDIRRPPLDEAGPIEVRRAAAAFNLMQKRLLDFMNSRLRTLTAISHDLKTPVTRLRLRAEMLDDPQLRKDFNRDLDDMDDMLGATLAYMRGEAEREKLQSLDINALLQSMVADAHALGQNVTLSGRASAPYPARPRALRRALDNLVQNALRYGDSAEIAVKERPRSLDIRVMDRGPGIPSAELEQVFEPFYRTEYSRNRATGGTGLGLSIARDVALSHGGTLHLVNRAGGGLEAILTLPR